MGLSKSLLLLAAVLQGQQEPPEFHFNLRGEKPLGTHLKFIGPEVMKRSRREEAGLRITLPADRKSGQPVGVRLKGRVTGDFEITGTFELSSDERPPRGAGAGVALNIAPDDTAKKFAKVGRFNLPQKGSVFLAEHWHRNPPEDYWVKTIPTEALTGQIRLTRKGTILHYLVADGLGDNFQQITEHEFGDEDIDLVRFVVNNNNSPVEIDARLIEFRIRSGKMVPANLAEPPGPSGFGRVGALWGLIVAVVILLFGGVSYVLARRKRKSVEATPAPSVSKKAVIRPTSSERRT